MKLRAAKRNALPSSEFGLPGSRKYPLNNVSHARNAKARASEEEHKGRISKGTEAKIDARADKKLHVTKKRAANNRPMHRFG